MQIINQNNYQQFLKRYDFSSAEIEDIQITSATSMQIVINAQSVENEYAWVRIVFYFDGINDAKLVDDAQLAFLDFENGISIVFENSLIGFCIDRYDTLVGMKNASFYITAKNLKVESFFIN